MPYKFLDEAGLRTLWDLIKGLVQSKEGIEVINISSHKGNFIVMPPAEPKEPGGDFEPVYDDEGYLDITQFKGAVND